MKKIPLTKGKIALVDDDDYDFLMQWKWCSDSTGYAARTIHLIKADGKRSSKMIYMHRVIVHPEDGQDVDHINHIITDNRRSNLRACTRSQNNYNFKVKASKTSKYKGVSLCKSNGKFHAQIRFNKKVTHLGYFSSEIEAAKAYNAAALKYHGEYARLNEI